MRDMKLGLLTITVVNYLKINVDDLDFVENKADYETILELIKKEL